jgi:hypothetical protein
MVGKNKKKPVDVIQFDCFSDGEKHRLHNPLCTIIKN